MVKRTLFGLIYVALVVAGILCNSFSFLLLSLLLVTLAVNEFLTMTEGKPDISTPSGAISLLLSCFDCVGSALLVVSFWVDSYFIAGLCAYLMYLIMRLSLQLWIKDRDPLRSLSVTLMAQLYIALPLALMSNLYRFSPWILLSAFILIWINDTFAYLCGVTLGRHKLWPRISPKKSWEGFWGGLIFTVAAGWCIAPLMPAYFTGIVGHSGCALLGLVVAIAATLGDLVESMLKRTVGVKDSGTLIPGHGGILDRIDSLLLVVPAVLIYIFLAPILYAL